MLIVFNIFKYANLCKTSKKLKKDLENYLNYFKTLSTQLEKVLKFKNSKFVASLNKILIRIANFN